MLILGFNQIQQLIVDLINEYDDEGYILTKEICEKYEGKIKDLISK